MATRYVDVDAEVGGTGETAGLTGATCAYKSLNIWEAARQADLTATAPEVCICGSAHASHTADTTAVVVSGWTATAANYIEITTDTGSRTGTSWSDAKYRLAVANATVLLTGEDYVRVDGLQIRKPTSSADGQHCVYSLILTASANDIRISNCLIRQAGNNSYTEPGILVGDADGIVSIWNCIIYGGSTKASGDSSCILLNVATASVYSCTLVGGYIGLRREGGTITAKNCYARGTAAAYSGTITMTNCAASDTTADGTAPLDNVAYDTTEGAGHAGFTNVTAGAEDFALKAGSALVGAGATLTDDPPGATALGVDILGTTRS